MLQWQSSENTKLPLNNKNSRDLIYLGNLSDVCLFTHDAENVYSKTIFKGH